MIMQYFRPVYRTNSTWRQLLFHSHVPRFASSRWTLWITFSLRSLKKKDFERILNNCWNRYDVRKFELFDLTLRLSGSRTCSIVCLLDVVLDKYGCFWVIPTVMIEYIKIFIRIMLISWKWKHTIRQYYDHDCIKINDSA
jgi:hypothetical protein